MRVSRLLVPSLLTLAACATMIGCAGMGGGSGIVGLVILVLDVIAIINILQSRQDVVKKLLWILVILFLPLLGLILWYLLGRK